MRQIVKKLYFQFEKRNEIRSSAKSKQSVQMVSFKNIHLKLCAIAEN